MNEIRELSLINSLVHRYKTIWHVNTLYGRIKADNRVPIFSCGFVIYCVLLAEPLANHSLLLLTGAIILYYLALCFAEPMITFAITIAVGNYVFTNILGSQTVLYIVCGIALLALPCMVSSEGYLTVVDAYKSIKEKLLCGFLLYVCHTFYFIYVVSFMLDVIGKELGIAN